MLVNQNRVLLVVIAVAVGCLVNMPQLKLKDPMMKAGVFSVCLYLSYAFLNSQGLVDGFSFQNLFNTRSGNTARRAAAYRRATAKCYKLCGDGTQGGCDLCKLSKKCYDLMGMMISFNEFRSVSCTQSHHA